MPKKPKASHEQKKRELTKYTTSSYMARFFNSLKPGQKFYTRDCLNFGRRSCVDKFLSRRVQDGTLIRLARGCFMLNTHKAMIPSPGRIAVGKAKAFAKKAFIHGINCLKEFFEFEHKPTSMSCATTGASSSFETVHGFIKYKSYAPRKLVLGDTTCGRIIRALWHHRNKTFASRIWDRIREHLSNAERTKLRSYCNLMPAWLVDIVKYNIPCREEMPEELETFLSSLKLRVRRKRDI